MYHLFCLILFLFSVQITINATAQDPDKIINKGETYELFTTPLENYFKLYPEKRPRPEVVSSALWRGYIATYEIESNKLKLKDIEILYPKYKNNNRSNPPEYLYKSVFREVFPDEKVIPTDWFTGLLVIPRGDLVNYVHMGYASEYESYVVMQINKNFVEELREFTHEEYVNFKERQFQEFKKTEEYENLYSEIAKQDSIEKSELMKDSTYDEEELEYLFSTEDFIREYVIEYSSQFLVDELTINNIRTEKISYISATVDSILARLSDENKFLIKITKPEKLYLFHFGLGTWIRNYFGLWGLNDSLLLECAEVKGVDMIHPDDASAVIIDSLWVRMQLVDIEYSIPEAVKITSVGYDADILKRLKEYLIFPEILWKAGYNISFKIRIKTDNEIDIEEVEIYPDSIPYSIINSNTESILENWLEIQNIIRPGANTEVIFDVDMSSMGRRIEEHTSIDFQK